MIFRVSPGIALAWPRYPARVPSLKVIQTDWYSSTDGLTNSLERTRPSCFGFSLDVFIGWVAQFGRWALVRFALLSFMASKAKVDLLY